MRLVVWKSIVLSTLLVVLVGCTPKPVPAPQTPGSSTSLSKPPGGGSDDAAWAKIVDAAKAEGKLTSYTFNLAGDPGTAIVKAFQDRYGIKVELVTGPGSVLIERLKSEKAAGKNIADVFDSAASLLGVVKAQGMTDSLAALPELRQKNIWVITPVVDADAHIISVAPSINTPYINTKLVKTDEEPKSYKDLLLPKWKGKIVIGTPSIVQVLNYMYIARAGLGLDEEFWHQLGKQDLQITPGLRETDALLVRGEAAIEFPGTLSTMAPLILQGAPIKAIVMKEGVVVAQGPAFSAMKEAPHPNAARLFVNWLISPEGQDVSSKARGLDPMRKDVTSSTPQLARVSLEKVVTLSGEQNLETDRIMREGVLAKLMGLKLEK